MQLTIVVSTFFASLALASPGLTERCGSVCTMACTKGQVCVIAPGCRQVCVYPVFCGGFAGIPCEQKGAICVDDPRDDCDPKKGGSDCGGLCVPLS